MPDWLWAIAAVFAFDFLFAVAWHFWRRERT